jgi:hypothetical protein
VHSAINLNINGSNWMLLRNFNGLGVAQLHTPS